MRRIIIIFPVLLACMVMGVSAGVNGSVVYGQTVETGTGDKGPDNPYEITGYLPDAVTVKDGGTTTVYGIPDDISPLYGDGTINDEYDAATGIETRRWNTLVLDSSLNYSMDAGAQHDEYVSIWVQIITWLPTAKAVVCHAPISHMSPRLLFGRMTLWGLLWR